MSRSKNKYNMKRQEVLLPTIASLKLRPGQRVLLRLDVNVPVVRGKIKDDYRLRRALPTVKKLLAKKVSIIIIGHLGRPEGKRVPGDSLKPIAAWFSHHLHRDAPLYDPFRTPKDFDRIQALGRGQVCCLENLRFYSGEMNNDVNFSSALACLADAYVNDAFGVCHRNVSSVSRLAKLLPAAAGPLLHAEVVALERVTKKPARPLVAVIGGAKLSTKLPLLHHLLAHCDRVLVGGSMANTLLAAAGHSVGASTIEKPLLPSLRRMIKQHDHRHKLILPIDVVSYCQNKTCRVVRVGHTGRRDLNNDIGPLTRQLFAERIAWAKTVVWNGPLGLFEQLEFSHGTAAVAAAVVKSKGFTVAGGGETVQALEQLGVTGHLSFVSTGGGAMLAFLAGEKLPGLAALNYYGK